MEHVERSTLHHSRSVVWDWHQRPGAFERLSPPWQPVEAVLWAPVAKGARQKFRVRKYGRWWSWEAQITEVVEGSRFVDVQTAGPFARWEHTHSFEPTANGGCVLEDHLTYDLPMGALGRWVAGSAVARDLAAVFAFRHARTRADLDRHGGHRPARIAITGSSGFVGSALIPFLTSGGHEVLRLVRRPVHGPNEVLWRYDAEQVDTARLERLDAVVHLAGETLGQRWTDEGKRRIQDSRLLSTKHLCDTLAKLERPPAVLVCASAVGFYGDRGDEVLDENSGVGRGFLADLTSRWEAATARAREAGIRVVNLRLGIVLDPRGGALLPMRLATSVGLGGPLGDGTQYLPWVALDDVLGLVNHAIFDTKLKGPVNATAPGAVTQARFARTLADVLGRPALMRVPASEIRLVLGEAGREMILAGQRVHPAKAIASGFHFQYTDLEAALRAMLGRPSTA